MGDETYQEYRDDRARVLGLSRAREAIVQKQHLASVSDRIAGAIVKFCDFHAGLQFHADRLREFVEEQCGRIAPGSADRVLRDLRQRGVITYQVVNRAQSLYRCGP